MVYDTEGPAALGRQFFCKKAPNGDIAKIGEELLELADQVNQGVYQGLVHIIS